MLMIGSWAMIFFETWRIPKDMDYVATEEEYEKFKAIHQDQFVLEQDKRWGKVLYLENNTPTEFDIGKDNNLSQELIEIVMANPELRLDIKGFDRDGLECYPVHPSVVYTMKMSHRYLRNSKHFKKCMDDIIALRKLGYGEIPEVLKDWYKRKMKATYDYSHPSLKQGKDAFFSDDGINYVYDHDTIHETVKLFDRPAFELIKDDGAEVFCSKEKFFASSEELKLATVIEETYTLALERSQIPNNFKPDPLVSFKKSLEKVCTSISSGFWREYAWENYYTILEMYDGSYVQKFKDGLAAGIVKDYKSNV